MYRCTKCDSELLKSNGSLYFCPTEGCPTTGVDIKNPLSVGLGYTLNENKEKIDAVTGRGLSIPKMKGEYRGAPKTDEDGFLQCPACGNDYLHHYVTEVYERTEDSLTGRRIISTRETLLIDDKVSFADGNPSERRDGVNILFWCEQCACESSLCLSQVKGRTEISVQPTYRPIDINKIDI